MKMRREARRHDTIASARHEAVRPDEIGLFRSGQRVLTVDGPGRVEAVYDGPFPGSEDYEVVLDGGLGGGRYTASQITEALPTTASVDKTAADDYPELGTLLYDRPDPAKIAYTAVLNVQAEAEDDEDSPDTNAPDDLSDMQTTGSAVTADWSEGDYDDDHDEEPAPSPSGRGYSHDMSRFCGPDCQDDYANDLSNGLMVGMEEDREPGESYKDWQERGYPHKRPAESNCVNCGAKLPQLHQVQVNRGAEHPTGGSQHPDMGYQGHPGYEVATEGEHQNREYYRQLKPKPVPMHTLSSLPSIEATAYSEDLEHPDKVFLRFGGWPEDERSRNNVTGEREFGVSTYELDHRGEPKDPDPGFERGHFHDESCEPNCDLDWDNEDYGNDTREEMQGRVHRAEQNRWNGRDLAGETGHLVKGKFVGLGHDAEPLLTNVRRVGDWIDHRHHFFPDAEPHRLARDPEDEDYEPPRIEHTAITSSGRYAKETRDFMDEDAKKRGHDMQWKGVDLNTKGKAAHYVGECKNCGHSAVAGDGWSSSYGHVTTDARSTNCDGPGSSWKTDMVHELMHQRMSDAISEFGQNVKNEQDKAWLRDQGFTAAQNCKVSHRVLGPEPKKPHEIASHLVEHHGFTHDQLQGLEDPGQGDALQAAHELEHDMEVGKVSGQFGAGERGGDAVEHSHGRMPFDPYWPGDARRHLIEDHGLSESQLEGYEPQDYADEHEEQHRPTEESGLHPPLRPHEHADRTYEPAEGDYVMLNSGRGGRTERGEVPENTHYRDYNPIADRMRLEHPSHLSSLSKLVTEARQDSEFRFHVTAAWSDIQAKAKRIRSQGGVQITHSTDLMVVGNVKGDHHVYETGLQRVPGRRQSVASYSCGCKWGAYHWGADDDLSRFAGRMCSHALALQYEAASRGMFGRDIEVDNARPQWVPKKVVVKYDIDDHRNITARSGLTVPEQAPILVAMAALIEHPEALRQVQAAVNDLFGDSSGETEPSVEPTTGPTSPPNPDENPATAGPLATGQPDNWGSIEHDRIFPRVSARDEDDPDGAEATLHEEPEGALPETDGSMADGNLTGGGGIGTTERPEDLLLSESSLWDVDTAHQDNNLSTAEDDTLTPENESVQIKGSRSVGDIVAEFQKSAGAQALMGGRTAAASFTAAERQALINESPGVQAGNADRLNIEGTHYALIGDEGGEDEDTWMA